MNHFTQFTDCVSQKLEIIEPSPPTVSTINLAHGDLRDAVLVWMIRSQFGFLSDSNKTSCTVFLSTLTSWSLILEWTWLTWCLASKKSLSKKQRSCSWGICAELICPSGVRYHGFATFLLNRETMETKWSITTVMIPDSVCRKSSAGWQLARFILLLQISFRLTQNRSVLRW